MNASRPLKVVLATKSPVTILRTLKRKLVLPDSAVLHGIEGKP